VLLSTRRFLCRHLEYLLASQYVRKSRHQGREERHTGDHIGMACSMSVATQSIFTFSEEKSQTFLPKACHTSLRTVNPDLCCMHRPANHAQERQYLSCTYLAHPEPDSVEIGVVITTLRSSLDRDPPLQMRLSGSRLLMILNRCWLTT